MVQLSPDGRHVGYLEPTGRKSRSYGDILQLVTARLDGRDRVIFRPPAGLPRTLSAENYGWAPGGRMLAVGLADLDDAVFSGAPLNGRYIVAGRNGNRARLLIECEVGNSPAFSPDGERVALACLYGPTQTVPLDGPGRPLSDPGESSGDAAGGALAWRPDGRAIATEVSGGIDIRTEPSGRILRHLPNAYGFSWSPDGRYYAYTPAYGEPPGVTLARASDGRRLRFVPLGTEHPSTALLVQWAQ